MIEPVRHNPWPITNDMLNELDPCVRRAYLAMDYEQRRHVAEVIAAEIERRLIEGNPGQSPPIGLVNAEKRKNSPV